MCDTYQVLLQGLKCGFINVISEENILSKQHMNSRN